MLGVAIPPQVKQENTQLKRLSLAPMAPPALPQEEPPEEDPDPAQCYRQQLKDLQEKISWLLAQRKDLTIQVQELQRQNQDLQDQLETGQGERQRLRAALGTSQRALKSFKRGTWASLSTGGGCAEAPVVAHTRRAGASPSMLVQKKEANRQSTILLQSVGPSAQLLAALQEVGRLTRELEEARQEQQQRVLQVKELEEQLGRRPELEELDMAQAALAAAEDEKLQLMKQLQEAEGRLVGLEEEVGSLREKLAQGPPPQSQTPEMVAPAPPPPPPPLPPPAPAVPVDPLSVIRQRKGLANLQRSKPEADDVKARAVQEMMERIKNGVVLRPAKERVPLGQGTRTSGRLHPGTHWGVRTGSRSDPGQRVASPGRGPSLAWLEAGESWGRGSQPSPSATGAARPQQGEEGARWRGRLL
ncbi:PREDICTED: shootin-1-like [Charadrius vociferus]|uniref:shootin-1-like n=1 Tax=Charadrius vociferus TaxID=50402 RepID=UPI000521C5D6|nr:PREDICTED: shootin-1-like [Charadrius vociferus]